MMSVNWRHRARSLSISASRQANTSQACASVFSHCLSGLGGNSHWQNRFMYSSGSDIFLRLAERQAVVQVQGQRRPARRLADVMCTDFQDGSAPSAAVVIAATNRLPPGPPAGDFGHSVHADSIGPRAPKFKAVGPLSPFVPCAEADGSPTAPRRHAPRPASDRRSAAMARRHGLRHHAASARARRQPRRRRRW